MNAIARTNKLYSMVEQQSALLTNATPSTQATLEAGFHLLFEQLLISVVLELADVEPSVAKSIELVELMDSNAHVNTSIRELKQGLSTSGHWLHRWYQLRLALLNKPVQVKTNDSQVIISTGDQANQDCNDRLLLTEVTDFIDQARELNNQY